MYKYYYYSPRGFAGEGDYFCVSIGSKEDEVALMVAESYANKEGDNAYVRKATRKEVEPLLRRERKYDVVCVPLARRLWLEGSTLPIAMQMYNEMNGEPQQYSYYWFSPRGFANEGFLMRFKIGDAADDAKLKEMIELYGDDPSADYLERTPKQALQDLAYYQSYWQGE